jgi:ABC-type sugar transport system permease subunit
MARSSKDVPVVVALGGWFDYSWIGAMAERFPTVDLDRIWLVRNELIIAMTSGGLTLIGLMLAAFLQNGTIPTKPIKRIIFILAHMVLVFTSAMFFREEQYAISILVFVLSLWCVGSIFKPIFRP